MMVHCARLQCGNMKVMCLNSGGKSTSPFPDTPFSRVRLPFSLREAAGLQTHRMVQAVPPEKRACFPKKAAFQLCVSAASRELAGSLTNVEGLRFAIVVGQFNEFVTRPLLAGALGTFKKHLVKDSDIDIVWVPGSFEIPVTAQAIAKSGKYHAVLCIGTVIRGDTTHYDAVANAAASGVLSASLNSGVPCIFGVLTCENLEQALHRAGGKAGNKGAEAAVTAMEMASLFYHQLPTLK